MESLLQAINNEIRRHRTPEQFDADLEFARTFLQKDYDDFLFRKNPSYSETEKTHREEILNRAMHILNMWISEYAWRADLNAEEQELYNAVSRISSKMREQEVMRERPVQ